MSPAVGNTPAAQQKGSDTQYTYGVTTAKGSAINSNDLLWQVQYPDGTTQQSSYDTLGEVASQTNRDGSRHDYAYDLLGRQVLDNVVTFANQVDPTVRALATSYDTLGDVVLATSKGEDGSVLNQVENVFDGLGNLVTQYQAHSGQVYTPATATLANPVSPSVGYQYTTWYAGPGNYNYSRLTGVTYPGGTQVSYAYTGQYGLDNSISRITSVADGGQTVESYRYLGLSTVVGATFPCPRRSRTSTKPSRSIISATCRISLGRGAAR